MGKYFTYAVMSLLCCCSTVQANGIQSFPSANLGLWPPVNITATWPLYVAAGGVVLSSLFALTVSLYYLDAYITREADKALHDYLSPQAYHTLTSKYDPNFDFDSLIDTEEEEPTISNFIMNYEAANDVNGASDVVGGTQHRLPKSYISATTANRWYSNYRRYKRQAVDQTSDGVDSSTAAANEGDDKNDLVNGIGPLQDQSQGFEEVTSGLLDMVSGWVSYAYELVNAATETFSDSSCQEQLICETYQRSENMWLWQHLDPLLTQLSSKFQRATNIARTGEGCAGFYRDCSYLDRVFGRVGKGIQH